MKTGQERIQHMEYFNIAIDGPAGAGKSTIAKLAAKRLGFVYVDTVPFHGPVFYQAGYIAGG